MFPTYQKNPETPSSRLANRKKKEKNDWPRLIKDLIEEKKIKRKYLRKDKVLCKSRLLLECQTPNPL